MIPFGKAACNMKLIVKSLICLFVTTLYTFVNVLLVFKSGMSISASLITPLLYYFLFKIFFSPRKEDIFYIQMVTTASSIATFGIAIAYVSIQLLDIPSPGLAHVMVLAALANVIAFYYGHLFSKKRIDIFGSEAMPAPASMAWASQAKGFIHLSEADHTSLLIVALSVLAGIGLGFLRLSASTIAKGILLPPSTTTVLLLGGASGFLWRKYRNDRECAAIPTGLIVGDGLITFIRYVFISPPDMAR